MWVFRNSRTRLLVYCGSSICTTAKQGLPSLLASQLSFCWLWLCFCPLLSVLPALRDALMTRFLRMQQAIFAESAPRSTKLALAYAKPTLHGHKFIKILGSGGKAGKHGRRTMADTRSPDTGDPPGNILISLWNVGLQGCRLPGR